VREVESEVEAMREGGKEDRLCMSACVALDNKLQTLEQRGRLRYALVVSYSGVFFSLAFFPSPPSPSLSLSLSLFLSLHINTQR